MIEYIIAFAAGCLTGSVVMFFFLKRGMDRIIDISAKNHKELYSLSEKVEELEKIKNMG